jgi:GT2 family glycosyltransferase
VSTPSISVVICAYTLDRWDALVSAVASLERQTLAPSEVILVVDHNPALLERVRTELPQVLAVENHEDAGLSGARNSGVAAASSEIVVFLDDDAVANTNWLSTLVAHFDSPAVAGVGGAVLPVWQLGRPSVFPDEFDWVVGCSYRGLPDTVAPVRNPIGCNMAFRRSLLVEIGGFRSGIGRVGTKPVGCEETEVCIRIQQRHPGSQFLYDPAAAVHHLVPRNRSGWSYFRSRCFAEGQSKAHVARFVGAKDGLASEVTYTLRTLTRGVIDDLGDVVRYRDPAGLFRATWIVAGLGMTTAGYLTGRAQAATSTGLDTAPTNSKKLEPVTSEAH